MIRAVFRQGEIQPLDPVPAAWVDGQELRIEATGQSPLPNAEEIDRWAAELREHGVAQYDPGELEQMEALLREADIISKAQVKAQMEALDDSVSAKSPENSAAGRFRLP